MTKREFLLKTLFENGKMTGTDILNRYYDECDQEIDDKRKNYLSKGIEKSEKELMTQIKAELQSEPYNAFNKDFRYIKVENNVDGRKIYFLTEEGVNFYKNNYTDLDTNDIDQEVITDDIVDTDDEISFGIVYLLKSSIFDDTYKIGITNRTIDDRLNDLKRDKTYGVFGLYPIMFIKCVDYQIIERMLHKFFENYRICKKNVVSLDTELFKGLDSIETEFESFANFLKDNPRFKENFEFIKL